MQQAHSQTNKFGLFPIRKCTQQEQKMIGDKFQAVKHIFKLNKNQAFNWVCVYLHEKFCHGQEKDELQMRQWVDKLISEVENGVPYYVLNYGFIKSPINAVQAKEQPFHIDYNQTYKSIFIPLTYLVFENSPRFFKFAAEQQKITTYIDQGVKEENILDFQKVDYLTVHQIISKPYVIIKSQSLTVHRGVLNRTNEDRYMFWIGYNKQKMMVDYETPNRQGYYEEQANQ